jgi:hypothetical protein
MYSYSVVCAWCDTLLEVKKTDDFEMDMTISHTICESCKKKMEESYA